MNFNKTTNRSNTESLKYDSAANYGKPDGLLPLWVADMDFPAPDCVTSALQERVAHGIFGYAVPDDTYYNAVINWFAARFNYHADPRWLTITLGVVYAINMAIDAFTASGDGILIQEPVYYPFRQSITANRRRVVVNELVLQDGKYVIDFADFEEKARQSKLFLLCSPHNPVGRVWTVDELRKMVDICVKHNVLIVADEIWCDFIYGNRQHYMLPALMPEAQDNIILCTAPSKTFNLAGLQNANIFISNPNLRKVFRRTVNRNGMEMPNNAGFVAARAAYSHGGDWLTELLQYIESNFIYIDGFLKTNLPTVKLIAPQGTYLAWLDCRALDVTPDELEHKLLHEAKIWLSRGDSFGALGAGFMRLNAACPHITLGECLRRMAAAL
ncbi:MAG: pyridoxal phosphate-dependent aminotransferase [Oscillospiraceae bacterium]|nr:pyridoxal phosphate-dependent aminotransferase [Oscillospiraceae bacterium]